MVNKGPPGHTLDRCSEVGSPPLKTPPDRVPQTQSSYRVPHTRSLDSILTRGPVMSSEADGWPIPLLPTRYKGLSFEDLALKLRADLYCIYRAAPPGLIEVALTVDAVLAALADGPVEGAPLSGEPVVPPPGDLLLKKVYDVALVGRPELQKKVEERGRQTQLPLVRLTRARDD